EQPGAVSERYGVLLCRDAINMRQRSVLESVIERNCTAQYRSLTSMDKGPERLGEILSRLITARGWGRRQERRRLREIWAEAVGGEHASQTCVGSLRRGVLEVVVANAGLMQELAHFHKRRLLGELRQRLPGTKLVEIRFRAGVVKDQKG